MNLCDYATIQELLTRHGFRFSKSMGQNFLINSQIPCEIAAASRADRSCGVLEIGPGIGPLTSELAQRAGKVVAVELDRALLPVLAETMAPYPNVEILSGDAMRMDLAALAAEKFQGLQPIVCANLPYNITSPVLEKLTELPCFSSITVLIQKEAAQRLTAPEGSSDSSFASLRLHYLMETEILFDVPASCFLPQPKVTSSVLRCVRRTAPAVSVEDEGYFLRVLKGAFLLRRKTLVNSLSSALPEWGKEEIRDAILRCGLPETIRGEKLTLQQFAELSSALMQKNAKT